MIVEIKESKDYVLSVIIYDYHVADKFEDCLSESHYTPFLVRKIDDFILGESGSEYFLGLLASTEKLSHFSGDFGAS